MNLGPVPSQQRAVNESPEVLLAPFLKDDFIRRAAVVVVIEVEAPPTAPGQLMRQFQDTMRRSLELIQRLCHRIWPDFRVGERRVIPAAHDFSVPDPRARCWDRAAPTSTPWSEAG